MRGGSQTTGIRPHDAVARIIATPVATIRPTATLREAANALVTDAVGLLVVVDARGVLGVLSERDIVSAIADDVDLDLERVRDRASLDLVEIDQDETILRAASTMAAAEVRHLAVTSGREVVGVVSIRDVLAVMVEAAELAEATEPTTG